MAKTATSMGYKAALKKSKGGSGGSGG